MKPPKGDHSTANIFVCSRRVFQINEDGSIPEQPCPVDYWTAEGKCTYCGVSFEDVKDVKEKGK